MPLLYFLYAHLLFRLYGKNKHKGIGILYCFDQLLTLDHDLYHLSVLQRYHPLYEDHIRDFLLGNLDTNRYNSNRLLLDLQVYDRF